FKYVGSLVDGAYFGGDTGSFDDVIKGLRDDPNGPQVDIEKDLIAKLGTRVTLFGDTEKPLGLYRPRYCVAVETTDEKSVARAVRRLLENDEDVKQRKLKDGTILWEIVTKEKKKNAKKGVKPNPNAPKPPNAAVAVARGQLFLTSNVKLLEKILLN